MHECHRFVCQSVSQLYPEHTMPRSFTNNTYHASRKLKPIRTKHTHTHSRMSGEFFRIFCVLLFFFFFARVVQHHMHTHTHVSSKLCMCGGLELRFSVFLA